MTADAASIRAACERVVSLAPDSQAYGPTLRTAIGVDENLFHAALAPFLRRCLLDIPEIFEVGMLWHERRDNATGEKLLVRGGSPTGLSEGQDWGKRPKGDSWPDADVVQSVLTWLIWYRRVIVLSADRRLNPDGVRALLNRQVGEVLNRDTSHGLSLTLLLKQPHTTVDVFGREVEEHLRREPFTPGFREHRL
jgi:hypothetical protein